MKKLSVFKICKDRKYHIPSNYYVDNMAISIVQKEISDI